MTKNENAGSESDFQRWVRALAYKRRENMGNFVELLEKLLIAEHDKTEEEAGNLIKKHPNVVTQGIMSGRLRATAMALEMAESEGAH